MIISTTNEIKDEWTKVMKNKPPKYRVNKTFSIGDKLFCTGDILTEIPEGYEYEKEQ